MADVNLNFTVPSDKVAVALQGFLAIYPNTEMTDDEPPIAKYTDTQWVREKIRRNVVRDISRGLTMLAQTSANVAPDDGNLT